MLFWCPVLGREIKMSDIDSSLILFCFNCLLLFIRLMGSFYCLNFCFIYFTILHSHKNNFSSLYALQHNISLLILKNKIS